MALVFTETRRGIEGTRTVVEGTFAFDSSYPTGGESWDPVPNIGLNRVDVANIGPKSGYIYEWDGTNKKVKAYQGDNANAASAPLIEVANATNLATQTAVPARFIGI